jgi:hypothetical protein
MGGVTNFSDTNQSDDNDNTKVVITGGDDAYIADVIEESGQKKLVVKSTNAPQPIGNLTFQHATNGGSEDMAVDGSSTPVEFSVLADATRDIIVEAMAFESFANGIKIDKFLSLNSELTNGILIEVKSEDEIFQFLPIKNTIEFDSHFAYGPGRSYNLLFASGNDSMVTRFGPEFPFVLKPQGTYASDDYVKVVIRDNISSINKLNFLIFGAYE